MASKRIAGITIEIGGDTTKLNTALKGVDKQLSATQTKLKDVNKLLKMDPGNTELLTQKQKLLTEAISGTEERLKTLKSVQKESVSPEQWDDLQREITETENNLDGLKKEMEDFGSVSDQKLKAVTSKMRDVGDKMASAGKTLTTHVTAPLVGLGVAAVKTTADFDKQMSKVQSIAGATGKDFDDLRNKAREMGSKTKFSASEAGEAFEYMAMAGWKTEDMLEGVEGIMNLAAASGENLGTTSDIVTDALTAFGLEAKDSGHFADVLAAASSNANTNVSMLGESFKYAAPVAGALGINAEDTSIALGLMANSGIKASQAGTNLRTGLTNMAKPTKQMREYMDKYNIALVENEDGSINLRKTMVSLREKMGNLSESEQAAAASAIFGKNSMDGWLAIINASDKDFNNLTSAIDNCDGSAENMAENMQDNLAGQLTILKSQLEELAISFGDLLMPVVRDVVSTVQSFVDKLNSLSESQKQTILRIAEIVAAVGPLLFISGKVLSFTATAIDSIKTIKTTITGLKTVLTGAGGLSGILGTGGPVILAITAAIAAGVLIYKNWDKIKAAAKKLGTALKKAWDGIKSAASTTWNAVKDTISKAWDGIKSATSKVWDNVKNTVSKAWTNLKTTVSNGANAVKTSVSNRMTQVKTAMGNAWTAIKTGAGTAWTNIRTSVSNGAKAVVDSVSNRMRAVKDTVKSAWDTVKTTIGTRLSSIASSAATTFNNVRNKITNAFKGLNITNPFTKLVSAAQTAISRIKSLFNVRLKFPSIKMPHFSISGKFSLNPPSVPKINVRWYKKAYENPYLFTSPTILQTPNGLKGFGDGSGGELVYGRNQLLRDIAQASGGDTIYNVNVYGSEGMNVNQLAAAVQNRLVALQRQKELACV